MSLCGFLFFRDGLNLAETGKFDKRVCGRDSSKWPEVCHYAFFCGC
jgi:hypothetical protein